MTRPSVRADLRALEGYHSPQVEVEVRLNTNESPEPPPAAWRDAYAAEISRVDWHRYPDRRAAALRGAIADLHSVGADQVFVANGSNEVLQTVLLAYGGPGRVAMTFEPTYQLHSHIARLTGTSVFEVERGNGLRARPRPRSQGDRGGAAGGHVPVLAEQPDGDGGDRGDGRARSRHGHRGSSSSTRPTDSSRRGRRSR